MVEYHQKPGVPGQFFMCPRYNAVLSDRSCAQRFREARATARETGDRYLCVGCPLGAQHAGVEVVKHEILGRHTCVRCFRQSTRIMRNSICVSCYNREREVAAGKNAKGNAFQAADLLREVNPQVSSGRGVKIYMMPLLRFGHADICRTPATRCVEGALISFRNWDGDKPRIVLWCKREPVPRPKELFVFGWAGG